MLRTLSQVFGAVAAAVFGVGGMAVVVLRVAQTPAVPRGAEPHIYGGPAIAFGLASIALAVFFALYLALPRAYDYSDLKQKGALYALIAFGVLFGVGFILTALQLSGRAI